MNKRMLAKRYARALFELAVEGNVLDEIAADLDRYITTIRQTPFLNWTLGNEEMPLKQRCAIIAGICDELRFHELTTKMLKRLARNGRTTLIGMIGEEFAAMALTARKCSNVTLTIASKLHAEQSREIVEKGVAEITGRTTHCTVVEDPSLIGGAILNVGDRIIDASVRGRLEMLRSALLAR